MWFCRHIIPTLGVLATFGVGCFYRKPCLSSRQKTILKHLMAENYQGWRGIFTEDQEGSRNLLKVLCALRHMLTPEEIEQLPHCSKDLQQRCPGINEVCQTLRQPSNKNLMYFLTLPIQGRTDYGQRLDQLEVALIIYGLIQKNPKLKAQSLIKEFSILIS